MKYDKNFIYLGLFLTKEEKQLLKSYANLARFETLPNYKEFLDHLTLLFKSDVNTDKGQNILKMMANYSEGVAFSLTITHIGVSDKAIAFKVHKNEFLNFYCMNETPHITIATINDGKPVDSNKISNWLEIYPIQIHPVIKIFKKN